MWELYASLPEKPEWLTMEDIDRHENQMTGMEQEQPKKRITSTAAKAPPP